MDAKQLESIIKLKEARVGVFGLGYVGLPLAVEIAKVGFTTLGADIDHKKLELLNAGINPLSDMTFVRSVAKYIGKYVKRGDLIINESTVGPGMTRKILCSVLESESGLTAGTDFFVVASPERIDPGNPIHLTNIPKVIGGINKDSTELAAKFYSTLMNSVVKVSSLETAEMVKMLENSFRALNIGFAN